MKNKKTNYQVTIGYKAVITVIVKAENEDEAKKIALNKFEKQRGYTGNISLDTDSYDAHGVLNMDETWNKV